VTEELLMSVDSEDSLNLTEINRLLGEFVKRTAHIEDGVTYQYCFTIVLYCFDCFLTVLNVLIAHETVRGEQYIH
jgi:hypothetical protein